MQRKICIFCKSPFHDTLSIKLLSEDQQTELDWIEGDYVADRQANDCSILIYQLYAFYVEVAYSGSINKFEIQRSFCSMAQLDCYLEDIDITSLTR